MLVEGALQQRQRCSISESIYLIALAHALFLEEINL
jgi:hypothetical protein